MPGCKCKVCGRYIRSVYRHYGGQSCSACAAFFIRAQQKRRNYNCDNQNLCLAIPSVRGSGCRKCRYQKCIDIGMKSATSGVNGGGNEYGEYMLLAKKLNAILTVITQEPNLLLCFFYHDDTELIAKCKIHIATVEAVPYVISWARIFQDNQLPLDEIHVLFYAIVCTIAFPWLSPQDQIIMSNVQRGAIIKNLQPTAYSTAEIKEGFDKLTHFFQQQYFNLFATPKFNAI